MEIVDRAVFFVAASSGDTVVRRLCAWTRRRAAGATRPASPGFWTAQVPVAPVVPNLRDVASSDFKIAMVPAQWPWGRSLAGGIERLVHHLRGIRIGLALGGGGALGMAHLGILKALEQSGIVVDMIARTSPAR